MILLESRTAGRYERPAIPNPQRDRGALPSPSAVWNSENFMSRPGSSRPMNDSTNRNSSVPATIQMVGALPTRLNGDSGGVLLSADS